MINKKIIIYIIAGLTTFLCEYLTFIILYQFINNENFAHSLSYVVAIFVNFSLLRYWVFIGAKTKFSQQVTGYASLVLVNFFLSNGIIYLLNMYGTNAYIAKALTMFTIIIWNYTIMHKLIFKSNS